MDRDGGGSIEYEEFLGWWKRQDGDDRAQVRTIRSRATAAVKFSLEQRAVWSARR